MHWHDGPRPVLNVEMSTADWLRIDPEPVPVGDLILFQRLVGIEELVGFADGSRVHSWCGDTFVHVVELDGGDRFLWDGHHRLTVALVQGKVSVLARVLRI